MSLLYWLDEKIINLLEKFCHKFQLWTGKTNFFLARVMIVVFIGSHLINFLISFFREKSWNTILGNSFFSVFYLVILLPLYVKMADATEHLIFSGLINGYKNPFKIYPTMRFFRIFLFWVTLILNLMNFIVKDRVYWYSLTADIGIVLIFYFLACDPMPPCQSSIKELFSSLFAKPVPVTSKS